MGQRRAVGRSASDFLVRVCPSSAHAKDNPAYLDQHFSTHWTWITDASVPRGRRPLRRVTRGAPAPYPWRGAILANYTQRGCWI